MTTLLATMYGSLIAMCAVAVLFFLRYWWLTRDRFFVWFAFAFVAFGVNWALVVSDAAEHTPYIYVVRFVGFLAIIAGIARKNRERQT